jgi:hypothetical protein
MSSSYRLLKQPVIYEINTAIFLAELGTKYGKPVTLGTVPVEEWQNIAALPVDAVWLMGVWERSPYSRKVSMKNKDLKETLPDFREEDNLGSPYSVRSYTVDKQFGGNKGLLKARETLRAHGLGLILDYVPNHIACDHDWAEHHPEYLISGTKEDLKKHPGALYSGKKGLFAYGKDPQYPPWSDVLQLNAFSEGLRRATTAVLNDIAELCDGVRCDMAMLLATKIFQATWGKAAGEALETEYWDEVLPAVRAKHPDFIFIAEVYWGLERFLMRHGFDYCYDKSLYDDFVEKNGLSLFQHLHADPVYQSKLLRFIENHDEPRAAKIFKPPQAAAAAFSVATLPGATLYHQGQLTGRTIKVPVQLGREPVEKPNQQVEEFYRNLIGITARTGMRQGTWQLCQTAGGFLRTTRLLAWSWTISSAQFICVVNYDPKASKGYIFLPPGTPFSYDIALGEQTIRPNSIGLDKKNRLSLTMQPWGYALFVFGA